MGKVEAKPGTVEAKPGEVGENDGEGAIVSRISREVVGIHSQFYGRGPTKAKTIWRHDVIVVILEEIFNRAEEVLVDAHRFDQGRSHRQAFSDHVEPLFRNVVEQATGRGVRAFFSQVTEEGMAAEVFVLDGQPVVPAADSTAPAG